MAHSLGSTAVRPNANSIRAKAPDVSGSLDEIRAGAAMAKAGANSHAGAEEIPRKGQGRELVKGVARDLGRSQKSLAIDASCPESDFSNGLNDKQRFDIDWLLDQDEEFVLTFIERLVTSRRLTADARIAIKRAAVVRAVEAVLAFADEIDRQAGA